MDLDAVEPIKIILGRFAAHEVDDPGRCREERVRQKGVELVVAVNKVEELFEIKPIGVQKLVVVIDIRMLCEDDDVEIFFCEVFDAGEDAGVVFLVVFEGLKCFCGVFVDVFCYDDGVELVFLKCVPGLFCFLLL